MNDKKLLECFEVLSSEARDLYLRSDVPVIEHPISALEFYRDWISANVPVVVKDAVNHWPAMTKWTNRYLRDKMGNKLVKVAATPNGYADAIAEGYFVMPEELEMTINDFLSILEDPNSLPETVLYVQSQNGNLSGEWVDLVEDCGNDLHWATEAFGEPPTAANFWMGDQRAVTSMHRDPFENIYCVVRGYKDFILHPPTDLPWIPYATLPVAKYQSVQKHNSSPEYRIMPLANTSESEAGTINEISEEAVEDPYSSEKTLKNGKLSNLCFKDRVSCDIGNDVDKCELIDSEDVIEAKERHSLSVSEEFDNHGSSESLSRTHVPWICIDPEKPDLDTYPSYARATQVKVRVQSGDVLFLPAYWFHHVRQSHACIAVNYWYDVRFDHRHAYQALITALLRKSGLNTGCPPLF